MHDRAFGPTMESSVANVQHFKLCDQGGCGIGVAAYTLNLSGARKRRLQGSASPRISAVSRRERFMWKRTNSRFSLVISS